MAKTREKYTEHPSIVVINGTPKLRVFEDFFIEEALPKWQKIAAKIAETKTDGDTNSSFMNMNNGSITDKRTDEQLLHSAKYERRNYIDRSRGRRLDDTNIILDNRKPNRAASWFRRIVDKIINHPRKGEPVEKVFDEVKSSMVRPTSEDLIHAKKLVDAVEEQLRATGQYEIADRVSGSRSVLEAEVAIVKGGDLKYVSEEQIVKFMLKSERGMRMEYLRYYANILPAEVAKKKLQADALLVFDNYCVLHYSSDEKFSIIKEKVDDRERERRRDPILFGMIKGSRKLYYITDWVTEDDDLTLEKLETVIGEKAADLGSSDFAATGESISKMLDRLVIDVSVETERAKESGHVITEQDVAEYAKTGVPPPSILTLEELSAEKAFARKEKKQ